MSKLREPNGSGAELRLTIPGAAFTEGGATTFLRENGVGSALATAAAGGAGLSRTEHDAFGNEAALQAGPRGPYRFVGRLGYYSDDTGLDLLGARYYVPALGRFLTRDPVGHGGGLNLYRYCGNNPLTKVDPDGKDWDDVRTWVREQIWNPIADWGNAYNATHGFVFGLGPSSNVYGPRNGRSLALQKSMTGEVLEQAIVQSGYLRGMETLRGDSGFGYPAFMAGHSIPAMNTFMNPSNGTQARVGGFIWQAWRMGDIVRVKILNEITLKSLFYQFGGTTDWKGWDRAGNGFGPFGTVKETFWLEYRVPKGK